MMENNWILEFKNECIERSKNIISICKSFGYSEQEANVYIVYPNKVEITRKIKGINIDYTDSAGAILIVYAGTKFLNCNLVFRKKTVVVIEKSKHKIANLKILNNNGDSSALYIGNNFNCNGCEIRLWEYRNVYIGADCMFSWSVKIFTSDGHAIVDDTGELINVPEDVIIADKVWLGYGSVLLKGSAINYGSVVGAGSIVTKKFNMNNVVITGTPASIRRENIKWMRQRLYTPTDIAVY